MLEVVVSVLPHYAYSSYLGPTNYIITPPSNKFFLVSLLALPKILKSPTYLIRKIIKVLFELNMRLIELISYKLNSICFPLQRMPSWPVYLNSMSQAGELQVIYPALLT